MRKDYMAVEAATAAQNEVAFVADYWTKVWRQSGGPTAAIDRVLRQEEFRIMQRYMPRLPAGARLLDGGCGLGEWTAHFTRQGYPTVGLDLSMSAIFARRAFPTARSTAISRGARSNISKTASTDACARRFAC
jgi:2-polyprenyl-3-methyl-5-hydroxy-6-metoxy-1,4-benzoquinol methylase